MKKAQRKAKVILTDTLGVLLIIIAPLLGWLPGPGGIPLFLAGLSLLAINHDWAHRFLKDFDNKRLEFTDKYLMKNPWVRWTLDIGALTMFSIGVIIVTTEDGLFMRAFGTALISFSVIIALVNQKRFDRIAAFFKNN